MKKLLLIFSLLMVFLLTGAFSAYAADNITGIWAIIDDKENAVGAYVLLYMYEGKIYGRMLALVEFDTGLIEDTIDIQRERSAKINGNPPICGMDFVYDMEDRGRDWRGSMIDPDRGRLYNCTIRRDGDRLIVRASLRGTGGILGANQIWLRANPSDLPGVTIPDPSSVVPVILQR